ncbi:phosphotransferase enzyme family protein [Paenibacillus lignilyticus]|uniref:Phosphotransferase n=1 Tax=Paenibacillus lignilyticus TaxID=1172615 RepID=A0ABS5CBA1_9BACL|nr:phosphotransferase [Paenibacillus lignilyticus]MBP3963235.1 phosphotransferase [Paenibacillus lignilyticus]
MMHSGFLMDTESNRHYTLKHTKQAALSAMQHYEIEWSSIHFIQISEHATFRVDLGDGEKLLLRIHPATKTRSETASELEWLANLRHKGLIVPVAISNHEGEFITNVESREGLRYYATLLKWVEGETIPKGMLTTANIHHLGEMMARLHETSADFRPTSGFVRPTWGSKSFKKDWEHLNSHYKHFISEESIAVYAQAAVRVSNHLDALETQERDDYGMIHADLHIGNIVYHHGEPFPIDFGRCGFGFHLYDIAQSIMGLHPAQRELFIEGYRKVRHLSEAAMPILESFFIMSMIEAYSFHAENELETEGLIEEQPYAQALLSAYMNGDPFLFQSLAV